MTSVPQGLKPRFVACGFRGLKPAATPEWRGELLVEKGRAACVGREVSGSFDSVRRDGAELRSG